MTEPGAPGLVRVVAIVGPTAAGKSRLGMEVAGRTGIPILCCDSVQVYRGLDIGSAKPSQADQAGVPHHLLDLVDPDEDFTVADYARHVHERLERGTGIIVGGTGFYLRGAAWTYSGDVEELPADDPRRIEFDRSWADREDADPGCSHRALAAVDPDVADQIHPRNLVRTIRALWLCELHGEPVSSVRKRDPPRRRLDLLVVVIDPGQAALDPAITRRCDQMLTNGWVDEVFKLKHAGYDGRFRAMRSLGYKQLLDHLEGKTTLSEAREQIVRSTRDYARRQRTFFRHQLERERVIRISERREFPWPQVDVFLGGSS